MDSKKNAERIRAWIAAGVEIRDENSVYIDDGVQIAAGAVIWPNNHLYGNTSVAAGAVIGPNNVIYDSAIGENCNILASVLKG